MLRLIIKKTKGLRYNYDKFTYSKFVNNHPINSLKNSNLNKPILIVGNGPSLNKTQLSLFKNVFSIGMNKIDLFFPKTTWRPNLVVCSNNLVVKQHKQNFIENTDVDYYLSWKSRFFLNRDEKSCFNFFLNKNTSEFQTNLLCGVGLAGTVTYTALQFAYFMGGNPIILVGVDHNFIFNGNPNDYKKMKTEDVNHFDPNYFSKGSYWGNPNLDLSEKGYKLAKHAFEHNGRIIYDATVDGKLNIFPKISIKEAVNLCSKI